MAVFEDCYARIGTAPLAGTLPLNAALLSSLYALPHHDEPDLEAVLRASVRTWPWSASLQVAPRETTMAVGAMLRSVMLATPDLDPQAIDTGALTGAGRARLHLDALLELWRSHPEVLPSDLSILRDFLSCGANDALQHITLVGEPEGLWLSALERKVLARLAEHHTCATLDDPDYLRLVGERRAPAADAGRLAGHIQRHLLGTSAKTCSHDDSFAVLSVRDSLTECEAALAIIQRWLNADPSLDAGDIGLFLPDGSAHAAQLGALARRSGVVLSTLPAASGGRNVGAETIHLFLLCCRQPAPVMARASLFASPILPWGEAEGLGARMARAIILGRRPDAGIVLNQTGRELLDLFDQREPATNKALCGRLFALQKLLAFKAGEDNPDLFEAKGHLATLIKRLKAVDEDVAPDWDGLIMQAAEHRVECLARGPRYPDAVSVLHARELPRRRFRKVLVLGFNEGIYPPPAPRNPIFLDSEIDAIEAATGLALPSRRLLHNRALERLRRQLCSVEEELVVLCSERDGMGKPLFPASSLALMTRLVDGLKALEDLVDPLAQPGGTAWDRLIDWRDPPEYKQEMRVAVPAHFALDRDLLQLRRGTEGFPLPQSPSRLEKLLVSPLAWALEELDAAHVSWQPETMDVLMRGTLAHGVFERLFEPGVPVPDDATIRAAVPGSLEAAIAQDAPFLAAPEWCMEREALESDILKSSLAWAQTLRDWAGEIVSNEFWLEGEVLGHPIHGKADTLLRLGDGQLVIVDHKKSSSGGRRKRLEKQSDLQVELYRRMQLKPARDDNEEPNPARPLLAAAAGKTGVAYHTMNDGAVLVNGLAGQAGGNVELFAEDISTRAMAQLSLRFQALRAGQIETNSRADEKHFAKTLGLGTYAFDESPLIRAFMRDDVIPSAFVEEATDD
ncbi:PD-(D/E)XK nuclease family protein [Novosphingobium sp. G106]|uniref:PD-(D/E)XK nuclease family protein n=1 Tax=Novosphingobium sp. G106 TaxID=2849500 RepID=UPI001C2D7D53|nr:PD-(D/E)XK nuclease family protein [Novosphingobium sp. G106]MBV1692054.1 PD-(D/E)XK nuclease family protein [Novosphingobium sp. G106]